MQRIVVLPAEIGEAGLAELKQWLGISRNTEDALLAGLLKAALEMCEAFTGQAPLAQLVEERLPAQRGLQLLTARPVREIAAVDVIASDGARSPLTALDYTAEIAACGTASFRLLVPAEGRALAVRLMVGIAGAWGSLPPPLRQGIIRLAAHYYRERDADGQRPAACQRDSPVAALAADAAGMIIVQPRMSAFAARLRRRAEALGERRARAIARETRAEDWRDPRALWPDFAED